MLDVCPKFKFDYSRIKYKGVDHKIEIICPEHGSFMQTPHQHLNSVYGYPRCAGNIAFEKVYS
jgi:hypothetical protein